MKTAKNNSDTKIKNGLIKTYYSKGVLASETQLKMAKNMVCVRCI